MEKRLNVGYIVKPQGVKGELKVEPLTDDITRYKSLKKVYIDDKEYKITHARFSGGVAFVCLEGVTDRNFAELFRNKYIKIDREDAVSLDENSYFIADLIGSNMYFTNGDILGEVIEIISNRTDIFTVKTVSNKIVRFPFLLEVVKNVDIENKKITIDKKRYLEVCCYED